MRLRGFVYALIFLLFIVYLMTQDTAHHDASRSDAIEKTQTQEETPAEANRSGNGAAKVDQAYDSNLQQDPKKSIRKGFFWIGIASTLSQILSATTMLILMIFLTKDELGIATIAVATGVIFEAFNALGTGQAFLQAKQLTQNETHSVFWFSAGFGIVTYLVFMPMAWILEGVYKIPMLAPMILVMMLKMPIVSIASVPLQLINRRFEYQKISIYQTVTSLGCSVIKIGLAIAGCGAWSLVIGESSYVLGTIGFAFYFSKYRPALHFSWQECKHFVTYGIKCSLSNALDQVTKNIHYLVVGKFLGEGFLGIYRIAYELAMTPALALFNVVARSSFPVFARLQDNRCELSSLFSWNQRNLALFAAIPSLAIFFCAPDIFGLFPNPDWLATIPIIPFVLAISFVKTQLQTYPDLYRACGKPEWPIRFQLIEAGGVFILGSACLNYIPEQYSLYAMMLVWLILLTSFAVPHRILASNFIDITMRSIAKSLSHSFLFILFTVALSTLPYIYRDMLPFSEITHICIEAVIIIVALWAYTRFVLKVSLSDFIKRRRQQRA